MKATKQNKTKQNKTKKKNQTSILIRSDHESSALFLKQVLPVDVLIYYNGPLARRQTAPHLPEDRQLRPLRQAKNNTTLVRTHGSIYLALP